MSLSAGEPIDPSIVNGTSVAGTFAPLGIQAIILPVVAFPSWILCLPPLVWQFRQGNMAAGSLILWVIMAPFFLSINALIWPRDNPLKWWDGHGLCDIQVRIQVATVVGATASTAMILRKLARVMDTNNMTVSSSRDTKLKEKALEIIWCWLFPLIFVLVYYIVQPVRYIIWGIVGCLAAYDTSWPSIVLIFVWGPLTTLVAAGYACLLSYRLYHYRREFVRLISARNTTKSRFIRLFVICIIVILIYVPYTFYYLATLVRSVVDPYDWGRVHDPTRFNSILKVPAFGVITLDRWVQVITGYVVFFVFGTGNDAHNTYKAMLLAVGLGRVFPGLHFRNDSGSASPTSFIAARTWTSSLSRKAKSMFSSVTTGSSAADTTMGGTTRNNSVVLGSMCHVRPVSTGETELKMQPSNQSHPTNGLSFFARLFTRPNRSASVLPLYSHSSATELTFTTTHMPSANDSPLAYNFKATAWAATPGSSTEADGVRVLREVHQDSEDRAFAAKEKMSSEDWA